MAAGLAALAWLSLGVLAAHANLIWGDGAYLFSLTQPTVAAGDIARWAIGTILATPVLIVD